jgi:hypothetical protein
MSRTIHFYLRSDADEAMRFIAFSTVLFPSRSAPDVQMFAILFSLIKIIAGTRGASLVDAVGVC